MEKIKLTDIVIIVLIIILFLQRCGGGNPENPTAPQITRDTVWVHKDSTITKQPQLIKTITIPVELWNTKYLPDTSSMTKLIEQYNQLVSKYLAINIQSDSIVVDSIGKVFITDSVTTNLIKNRKLSYNFKFPTITTTITVPEPKKVQWYGGGFIQISNGNVLDEIGGGILIKNKRDQIYGGHIGLGGDGKLRLGVSSYWKIKLQNNGHKQAKRKHP
jgi:hypothetical protein